MNDRLFRSREVGRCCQERVPLRLRAEVGRDPDEDSISAFPALESGRWFSVTCGSSSWLDSNLL